jgi:hypothetical protein
MKIICTGNYLKTLYDIMSDLMPQKTIYNIYKSFFFMPSDHNFFIFNLFLRGYKVSYMWTTWTEWSTCSVSCGGGVKSRSRTCTIPTVALNGEEECEENMYTGAGASCNKEACTCKKLFSFYYACI